MINSVPFIAPKLTGNRFNDHTLPVNILEDFIALEELIFELAKKIYLDENPTRKRVPKGFTEGVNLKLSSLEEGSTITNFILVATLTTNSLIPGINPDSFQYLEKAKDKIIETIQNANTTIDFKNDLDPKFINYFNRIGKNLLEDEQIDFNNNIEQPAKLDRTIRKKILLSRNEKQEYSQIVSINALIPAIDKSTNTFTIEVEDSKIICLIDEKFMDSIISSFNEYEKKSLVSLKGTGIYNSHDKLIRIEEIESMDILDPFDVSVRLNQLSKLTNGWYEGTGKMLNSNDLIKFEEYFKSYYNPKLSLPAIFPTIEGNIQLEWSSILKNISLEINLKDFTTDYLCSNKEDDKFEEQTLDLNKEENWQILNSLIEKNI